MKEFTILKSFDTTLSTILDYFKEQNIHVFDCINQQKAAEEVGLTIPKTTLILFGKPELGTELMQQNNWITFELPSKILLIAEDELKTKLIYRLPKEYIGADKLNADGQKILEQLTQLYNDVVELFRIKED